MSDDPCPCPLSDHQHGTVQRYLNCGCRCALCRDAVRVRKSVYTRLRAYGQWPEQWCDPTGIQRRLQGLLYLGFTGTEMAEYLGVHKRNMSAMIAGSRRHGRARTSTLTRVDAMTEEFLRRPLPTGWKADMARQRARDKGYASPWAWDDIDDPEERPKGAVRTRNGKRVAA